ncbi:MAG: serine/threonine-protein kinase [Planctomycetota bacterium]
MHDVEFLALLVHRGHLDRGAAEPLIARLQAGASLDELLGAELGWDRAKVERLRRTRAGEIPEIPGFDVLEKTGTGGTSDVFRAREKKAQRVLALKVLKGESTLHEPTRKAFIAEARLLERLSHPNLVRCYGIARSGNTFFSKLEYVEGKTVLELLDGGREFSESEALRITLETAEVLQYLGEHNVIHRDVKPGNIMLDEKDRVVLIDLGFAAAEGEAAAGPTDSAVGTVAYLSPEQARGGAAADCRSDIYSLGISLFHLVVGRLPFESSNDREVLRMQIMDSLSSPELKGRGISPHLHYFIEKMVAKEATHRYQGFGELIDDIRTQLAGREGLNFADELREKSGRHKRRR